MQEEGGQEEEETMTSSGREHQKFKWDAEYMSNSSSLPLTFKVTVYNGQSEENIITTTAKDSTDSAPPPVNNKRRASSLPPDTSRATSKRVGRQSRGLPENKNKKKKTELNAEENGGGINIQ